ncbi:hypothetical protein AAHA92_29494 [Salvia divinorum]|uniref:Myb/SANT-like domain-containing protein n=1 Tax=Salvia divinorum TaxID=28513 RepID=A0ABD1FYJ3_SALDI
MSSAKCPAVRNSGAATEGMNGSRANKFRKGDQSRRLWTVREEEILIGSLLELVADGWKSDNGFSGISFNADGEYKIDIDDDQWAQVVAADINARFMRNKSWPHWKAWKCIFRKVRAHGGRAEDVDIASATVRAQMASGSPCNENDYHPSFEDFILDEVPIVAPDVEAVNSSSAHTEQAVSTPPSSRHKRKSTQSDDVLMEFLGNLHAQTNSRLDIISSKIGYEFDLGKARQDVFDKLGTMDGLTLDQRYDLCDILGDKPQRLEVFIRMPTNARFGYAIRLIHQDR